MSRKTPLYFADEAQVIAGGRRTLSPTTVRRSTRLIDDRLVMLTGDNRRTAR
ncbi:MAG: hypothetical protein ACLVJ6_04750 [Merdibacter sp.]